MSFENPTPPPVVSVIIPTYNRRELVREAVDSVLSQTYKDFELLVVDDGSTDSTGELIKGYSDPRVRYFYLQNNGKPAPVRNYGIEQARGRYIAFLDSDDQWMPEKLQKQIAVIEEHPDLAFCATNARFLNSRKPILSIEGDKVLGFTDLLSGNQVANSSVLVPKQVIDAAGPIDIHLSFGEDYEYWLRILHRTGKTFYIIGEPLMYYRQHAGSLSSVEMTNRIARLETLMTIVERFAATEYSEQIFPIIANYAQELNAEQTIASFLSGEITLLSIMINRSLSAIQKCKAIIRKMQS